MEKVEITDKFSLDQIKEEFKDYKYSRNAQAAEKLRISVIDKLGVLADQLRTIRKATADDDDVMYDSSKFTLEHAINSVYGTNTDNFLNSLGVNTAKMSLNTIAKKISGEGISSVATLDSVIKAAYSGNSVSGIDPAHSLLYTELLRTPIVLAFNKKANYLKWIAGVVPVKGSDGKIPVLNFNDLYARDPKGKVSGKPETAKPRSAVIEYKDKPYRVDELVVKVKITDKMIRELPFDTLRFTIQMAAESEAPTADNYFINYLYNGDMDGVLDKPPVIGVDETGKVYREDFARLKRRAEMNGVMLDQVIPSDKLATGNLSKAPTSTEKTFTELFPGINVNNVPLVNNAGVEKINRSIAWDSKKAIVQLSYEKQQFETDRDADGAAIILYFRMFIGFAVYNSTAIMHLAEDLAFNANQYPPLHPIHVGNIGAGA